MGLNQTISSAESFSSYREWSTLDWLNYHIYPRLTVSIGAGFGYLDYTEGTDMTYEQLQGRVTWHATEKIGLQVHGGAEDRQFLDGSASDLINPLFGASIDYRPIEATTVSVAADHAVTPSYFNGQISETTTFSINLSQRLFKRIFLGLGGGYSSHGYVATTTGEKGRNDDYYFFSARATAHVIKRGTISVFYQYSDNSSNESTLHSFSSNQVGFELGYSY